MMNGRYGFRVNFEEANGMTVYVCCRVISHGGMKIESEPPSCSCSPPTQPMTSTQPTAPGDFVALYAVVDIQITHSNVG